MQPFRLIIFDCDGVLVDSERITNRIFVQMLGELGLTVSFEEMFERFVGRSMAYCRELIATMLGRPVSDDFLEQYRARTTTALEAELKPVAGIEKCLDALDSRRVPYCVASNGTQGKMRSTLGITGLLPRFEGRLYSVTEVAQGKPAPDLFLYAAARQGVAPEACCVIEDTPTGVTAGVAAGITTYGYSGLTPAHRLIEAGAHATFADMAALPELLFGVAAGAGVHA